MIHPSSSPTSPRPASPGQLAGVVTVALCMACGNSEPFQSAPTGDGGSSGSAASGGNGGNGGVNNEDCKLGSRADCAAESCADLLAHGVGQSGRHFIDPSGAEPFEVYCEQEIDGGGWALVWKNHGGRIGGSLSNRDIKRNPGVALVLPNETKADLRSAKHDKAYEYYSTLNGASWLKMTRLWASASDRLVDASDIRVELGARTDWEDLFQSPSTRCLQLPDPVTAYVDGARLGSTDYAYRLSSRAFGLATNRDHINDTGDGSDCSQPDSNILKNHSELLTIYDNLRPPIDIMRVFLGYRENETGLNASRCHFVCWVSNAPIYYEAFVWGAR